MAMLPPKGAEVWWFTGAKAGKIVNRSWVMRGAHETEARVYLKLLTDGLYDRVDITYEERVR